MKKPFAAFLACMIFLLSSCANRQAPSPDQTDTPADPTNQPESVQVVIPEDKQVFNVSVYAGPSAFGLVKLIDETALAGDSRYVYDTVFENDVAKTAERLREGKTDMAVLPVSEALPLFENTDNDLTLQAVVSLGAYYIAENGNELLALEDLRDKTLYVNENDAFARNSLEVVLAYAGIPVGIEYRQSDAECLSALTQNDGSVAFLPQAVLFEAQGEYLNLRGVFDVANEYETLFGAMLPFGVVIARSDFENEQPDALRVFLGKCRSSVAFTVENYDATAVLLAKHSLLSTETARKLLPYGKIIYMEGDAMRNAVGTFIRVVSSVDPTAFDVTEETLFSE